MITALCANAGMDKTYEVRGFEIGGFHHPEWSYTGPGGKGINVARVLHTLGHEATVTGFAGGHIGEYIVSSLRREGIGAELVAVQGESRLCINIIDPGGDVRTRVDENGPLVQDDEVSELKDVWERLSGRSELVSISGSAAPGVPVELYGELIALAHEHDVPVILDAHDEMLEHAIGAAPTVLKPNLAELSSVCGRELSVPDGVVSVCRELVDSGIETVVCSLGGEGAIAVGAGGEAWRGYPPKIDVISPVGAGDAMVAGIAAARAEGRSAEEQLCLGIAAGAACAASRQASELDRESILTLVPEVEVRRIPGFR